MLIKFSSKGNQCIRKRAKLCSSQSVQLNERRIKIDENSFKVVLWTIESVISSDQDVFICLLLIKLCLQSRLRVREHSNR